MEKRETPLDVARAALREVFGYSSFRALQEEALKRILIKKDTLVIMPTGGGKSLCYQIPALLFPGLTIVVSPLIALMKDQVEALQKRGIPAYFLNSTLDLAEYEEIILRLYRGDIRLLYIAPETLMKPSIRGMLCSLAVDCLAIDEAHCISEWGDEFRPEYRQLYQVRKAFPDAVCVALTATATPAVQRDICDSLRLPVGGIVLDSFDRPNLFLAVGEKFDIFTQASMFIRRREGVSGMIYRFSRREVEALAMALQDEGLSVAAYHAGLDEETRSAVQEQFIRGEVDVIVATVAFGMGIDKPDVRFVLHADLPKSMEQYYQQIGRAGRDGKRADCVLLYEQNDMEKLSFLMRGKTPEEQEKMMATCQDMWDFAQVKTCRRVHLLNYFQESYKPPCGMCDNCLRATAGEGI